MMSGRCMKWDMTLCEYACGRTPRWMISARLPSGSYTLALDPWVAAVVPNVQLQDQHLCVTCVRLRLSLLLALPRPARLGASLVANVQ